MMVGENNFERNVQNFISDNKDFRQGYIYDYKIHSGDVLKVDIYYAGNKLSDEEKKDLVESAARHGIPETRLEIKESDFGSVEKATDRILKGIYERTENEMERKEAKIDELQREILELKGQDINYRRVAREVRYNYPDIKDLIITKGATVDDSLRVKDCTIVLAHSDKPISQTQLKKVEEWLKLRLEDTTATVHNIIDK